MSVLPGEKSSGDGCWRLQGDVRTCVWPLNRALENNSNGRFCYMYFTVIKKMGKMVLHDLLSVTQGVNAGVQI